MRMWMVDPQVMCGRHLGGEWRELFAIAGMLVDLDKYGRALAGHIRLGQVEPQTLEQRYAELRRERIRRYGRPGKTLPVNDLPKVQDRPQGKVDREGSLRLLITRCPECWRRYARRGHTQG